MPCLACRTFPGHSRSMRDISLVVAFLAALTLLAAAAAWWKVVSEPEHEPSEGRVGIDSHRVKSAAKATAIAFCLSGVAAILAVLDWFLR